MLPQATIRQALNDERLLGSILEGDSWKLWRVLLIAAMGEPLDADERELFKQITQRDREPGKMVEELAAIVGRRGGKSKAIGVLAAYIAGLCRHPALTPGERGVLLIIAPDQRQADICLDYITAAFERSSILRQLVEGRLERTLRLNNRISIEVRAAQSRHLRGPTYISVIADESAFWLTENSANPDDEILAAVRPGLATTNGPLFMISSPYARRGELWRVYNKHWGQSGDPLVLVAQGATRTFNPSLSQSVVDRAYEHDPISAAAEYGGEFRRDVESFVSIEAVQACISKCILERAPQPGLPYLCFVDASGGSSDSMTLCIAHNELERETVVLDWLREIRAPFSPEVAVSEFAQVMRSYSLSECVGDKYAAAWPVEQFARYGVVFRQEAERKSVLYSSMLAAINSKRVDLLDSERLVGQLTSLERRTGRGGETIDHPPGAHDDVANAASGAVSTILQQGTFDWRGYTDQKSGDDDLEEWRKLRRNVYYQTFGRVKLWG